MSAPATDPWFSFFGGPNNESTCFYDKQDFAWAQLIELNWPVIKEEMNGFMEKNRQRLFPYFNEELVSGSQKWKALSFLFWTMPFKENIEQCPRTMALLKGIPGIVSISISMLEPYTQIKPHKGDTNAVIRCHLGIEIPASLPECGFQVGEDQRSWEEGKLLLFNDASRHLAWNNTDRKRVILLLDVIRPEYLHKKKAICNTVLAALLWQYLSHKMKFLKRSPRLLKIATHAVLKKTVSAAMLFRKH